jgi:hypothetical protein
VRSACRATKANFGGGSHHSGHTCDLLGVESFDAAHEQNVSTPLRKTRDARAKQLAKSRRSNGKSVVRFKVSKKSWVSGHVRLGFVPGH